MADLGSGSTEGVTGGKLVWERGYNGWRFSFSLRNHLREDVKNVHYYVIFYDDLDDPIDVLDTWFTYQIPAGLAKRVKYPGKNPHIRYGAAPGLPPLPFGVDGDVYELTKRVEFRILNFEIVR